MSKIYTKNKKNLGVLMSIPVAGLVAICVFGLLVCISQVFLEKNGSISVSRFLNVINSKVFIKSFLYTYYIAFVQSIVSITISFFLTYFLIVNNLMNKSLYIPISFPHIVVAMFTIYIFAKNGILSHILHNVGIIENSYDFPSVINDKYGIGIIIAYVFKSSAYCLSVMYIAMRNVNNKYFEVSRVIGLNNKEYMFDIIYPMLKKTLLFCFLVIFVYSFGAYEIPFLLGNTQNKTLPILAYFEYIKPNLEARTVSQTYNFIMLIIGVFSLLVYSAVLKNTDRTYE